MAFRQASLVFGRCWYIRVPPHVVTIRHMEDGTWRCRFKVIGGDIQGYRDVPGFATKAQAEVYANAQLAALKAVNTKTT